MLQCRKRSGFVPLPPEEPAVCGRLTLRDGTIGQIRMARPEDRDALCKFFKHLSPESRHRRFFSAFLPRPELIASLCESNDPHSALTLLVIGDHNGEPQIIATGSYLAEDKQSAEVAFAVDDAYQGQGLGTLLLARLALLAVRHGFTRFWAVTQADNQLMLDVFRESGFPIDEKQEGAEVKVNLSIVPRQKSVTSSALGMGQCDKNA